MPIIAVFSGLEHSEHVMTWTKGVADLIPWNLIPSIQLPEYDGAVSESGKIVAECAGVVFWYDGIASQYDGIVSEDDKIAARRSSFWIPSFWLQWSFLNPTKNLQVFNMFNEKNRQYRLPQLVSNHLAKECGGKSWDFQMLHNGGQWRSASSKCSK